MYSCNNDNNRESILEKVFLILASLYLCAQLYKIARNWYTSLTKKERKILWITVVVIGIVAQFFE
jgi:quinol-cytochrome oxidoreductase complex cytochrome b subunit